MAGLTLTRQTYLDKVHGGWLGKNAGGTLGSPIEGKRETFSLKFYDPKPGQTTWNEDLDFQLVSLAAVRASGPSVTSEMLAAAYLDHIAYRWDEYGCAIYNLRRGLRPPISGAFNNWFRQSDGAAIRTELWAMLAPGSPQAAAELAYRDAVIDHSEEGVWAAMSRAAMQSAAFFVSDPSALLDVALAMAPATCRTSRAIRTARDAWRNRSTWLDARAQVIESAGGKNVTDAALNMGICAIGLLYGGGDFGATLCAAANCGFDADGNAGALGALLGISRGKNGLPREWLDPIGESVVLGWGVVGLDVERQTSELAAHTIEAGESVIAAMGLEVSLVDSDALIAPVQSDVTLDTPPAPPEPVGLPPEALSESDSAAASDAAPRSTGFALPDLLDNPASAMVEHTDSTEPAIPSAVPSQIPTDSAEVISPAATEHAVAQSEVPDARIESESAAGETVNPVVGVEGASATTSEPTPVPNASAAASTEQHEAIEPKADAIEVTAGAGGPPSDALALPIPSLESPIPVVDVAPPAPPAQPAPPAELNPTARFLDNTRIRPLLVTPSNAAIYSAGAFEITVDYGDGGPALIPNQATSFTAAIRNRSESEFMGHVSLGVPTGWQVGVPGAQGQRQHLAPGGMARYGFVVRVPEEVPLPAKSVVTVILTPESGVPTTCDVHFLAGTCWWFVGPFANVNEEGFHKTYPVEDRADFQDDYLGRAGGMIRWQKMAFRENVMDLEPLFGGTAGVAYGVTTIHVPTPTAARIVVHTNDGVRLWVNKQPLLQRHSHELFRPTLGYGPAQADVDLLAGDNQVMLKVIRCREPVELAFSLVDRKGEPILDAITARWQ